jgi:hypothetical protein
MLEERSPGELTDSELDVVLPQVMAARDEAAAFGYPHTADLFNAVYRILAGERDRRRVLYREVEDAMVCGVVWAGILPG